MKLENEKFVREILHIVDRCRVETCKYFNGALFVILLLELMNKYELSAK